ncbi:MAG: hypothetical protein PHI97_22830 [Desulfobulbus sp.]|nr:hypothetical protein [Desulfobulbus sp.]
MSKVINKLEMLRGPYRSLLNTGRTYAAFEENTILPLILRLNNYNFIADPMAGFGGLMRIGAKNEISTLNIELNPPSYLWMVVTNPINSKIILNILNAILAENLNFLKFDKIAEISSEWFSDLSINKIILLYSFIYKITKNYVDFDLLEDISLSILLPFVGRFSSYVNGNIVTHVKKGGICVYKGIFDDFYNYILSMRKFIENISNNYNRGRHSVFYGDLRTFKIKTKINAFITSPPYPNSRDYDKMFAPENNCLSVLKNEKLINGFNEVEQLISSPIVSKYKEKNIDYADEIFSESAVKFIDYIVNYNSSKNAMYDNKVYYAPYFTNYFLQIQKAYKNFIGYLDENCEGFIVVVNNTARGKVIPVAESIVEIFKKFGFESCICSDYTRELFHFGSINPRAKGFRAKHMEYIINVRRGGKS